MCPWPCPVLGGVQRPRDSPFPHSSTLPPVAVLPIFLLPPPERVPTLTLECLGWQRRKNRKSLVHILLQKFMFRGLSWVSHLQLRKTQTHATLLALSRIEGIAIHQELCSVFVTMVSASISSSLQYRLSTRHLLHVASTSLPVPLRGSEFTVILKAYFWNSCVHHPP